MNSFFRGSFYFIFFLYMTYSSLWYRWSHPLLELRSPHDSQPLNIEPIGLKELPKVMQLFQEKRHQAIKLLHHHGSDDLIEAFLKSGVYNWWHRLKFTTRVDETFQKMIDSSE
jgi:hypothetical protein